MADQTAQSYANHTRYFPIFHFFAAPILTIQAFLETSHLIRSPNRGQFWETLVAWALAVGLFSARAMAIRAQDRVIRLEETLRMQRLLPADMQGAIGTLRPGQMVALRFASDAELPGNANGMYAVSPVRMTAACGWKLSGATPDGSIRKSPRYLVETGVDVLLRCPPKPTTPPRTLATRQRRTSNTVPPDKRNGG